MPLMGVPPCCTQILPFPRPGFLAFEASFVFLTSVHERDITLLAVGFIVMIVYPLFAPSKMDPFIGCMDGKNVPHIIVCDVVFVFYLRMGQNI